MLVLDFFDCIMHGMPCKFMERAYLRLTSAYAIGTCACVACLLAPRPQSRSTFLWDPRQTILRWFYFLALFVVLCRKVLRKKWRSERDFYKYLDIRKTTERDISRRSPRLKVIRQCAVYFGIVRPILSAMFPHRPPTPR